MTAHMYLPAEMYTYWTIYEIRQYGPGLNGLHASVDISAS